MKKVTSQSIIGQQGVNLIEKIVEEMGYVWRPTPIFDVGIDGEIEIRDPTTGEMTNTIIKVQSKATTQPFSVETDNSFEYRCEQKDLDYWLQGNVPIILIVCHLDNDKAYWISIRDYFSDPATQKTRKVLFDKKSNCFDPSCADALRQLAMTKDSGIYFAPMQKTETLYTNLLKVTSTASNIYVAGTNYRKGGEVWEEFNSMDAKVGSEWLLIDQQIFSFHDLKEAPFNKICNIETYKSFDTKKWADSQNEDTKRHFVQLLNKCLKEKTYTLGLNFYKDRNYYYFRATKELRTRKVPYQNLQKRENREVFKQYSKISDPSQSTYCRHSAFRGHFLRLGAEWYLEITPTYHFSLDGYNNYKYSSERLQGIKRLERNRSVFGQLLMWADYLNSTQALLSRDYSFLRFGQLETVEINTSIPDAIWNKSDEKNIAEEYTENQLDLFDL